MQYILACSSSFADIQTAVNSLLADGWRRTGGIAVTVETGIVHYYQALVK